MALDLVTPFTKVQLEEEIKDTGRKQVGKRQLSRRRPSAKNC